MKKIITLNKDGYRTVWQNSNTKGMIDVDIFKEDEETPCLEWSYGKVVGNSILGNANFWLDQAIAQARG
jgi:hypothetical protein